MVKQRLFKVSFSDIEKSEKRIASLIRKTSLTHSAHFSNLFKTNLFFKWENEQEIKSFKIRGALNKILALSKKEKNRGLIAASAGNHAQGVAWAARHAGIKARVVMMKGASKVKVEAAKKYGAEVILKGETYDESYSYAQAIQGDSLFIHPFADPLIIAGQGTMGLEIAKSLPEVSSVLVSIGGGGMISGLSIALKHLKPKCRIYGVVWDGTPYHCRRFHNIYRSGLKVQASYIKEKRPQNPINIDIPLRFENSGFLYKKEAPKYKREPQKNPDQYKSCLCGKYFKKNAISEAGLNDGIAVKKPHQGMFEMLAPLVEDIICVSREEIGQALSRLFHFENRVVEGSGAAALAALLKQKAKWKIGSHCCIVISGGNIDSLTFKNILKTFS